jgi:hypothetical protein
MAKLPSSLLLEVDIVPRDITSWEWSVSAGDNVHAGGFAETRLAARFAGNEARFRILGSGRYM